VVSWGVDPTRDPCGKGLQKDVKTHLLSRYENNLLYKRDKEWRKSTFMLVYLGQTHSYWDIIGYYWDNMD